MKLSPASLTAAAFVLFASSVLSAADKMQIILWNTHNGSFGDRGAKVCKVEVFSKGSLQWKDENVEMAWSVDKDEKTFVNVPSIPFVDVVRVTILKHIGNGGGLTEIQVMDHGVNRALNAKVTASGYYKNPPYPPEWAVDGITSSAEHHKGYWLLNRSKSPGWIEITLNSPKP